MSGGSRCNWRHHQFERMDRVRPATPLGGGYLDHQLDDMAGGSELAVLSGGGDLAEHVLVEVALGVAVLHGYAVEQVHHLGEQRRRGDGEAGVFHMVCVGRVVST